MKTLYWVVLGISMFMLGFTLVLPLFDNKSGLDFIRNVFSGSDEVKAVGVDDWENNTSPFYWENFTLPDNSFGIDSYNISEVNASYFWRWASKYVRWDCWGWNPNTQSWQNHYMGVPLKGNYFFINRTRSEDNASEKLNLALNPPFKTRYRIGLAVDSRVTDYVNRSGQYEYTLTIPIRWHNGLNYTVVFNWSDIIEGGWLEYLTIGHGLRDVGGEEFFYYVMTTDVDLNTGRWYELDPIFGYSGAGGAYTSIKNLQYGDKRTFTGGVGKAAYNITCPLTNPFTSPMTKYKCALFWASNGTFFAQTEERNSYGYSDGHAAEHNFTFNPPVYLVNNTEYYIVAFGNNGNIGYIQQGFPPTWEFTKTNSATYPTWDNATWSGLNGRQTEIFVTYHDAPDEEEERFWENISVGWLTGGNDTVTYQEIFNGYLTGGNDTVVWYEFFNGWLTGGNTSVDREWQTIESGYLTGGNDSVDYAEFFNGWESGGNVSVDYAEFFNGYLTGGNDSVVFRSFFNGWLTGGHIATFDEFFNGFLTGGNDSVVWRGFFNGWLSGGNTTSIYISLSDEEPSNNSIGISLQPSVNITVNHSSGYIMNVTWLWGNSSVNCTNIFGYNLSVANGTFRQPYANATENNTVYFWRVVVNDSMGIWENATYNFETGGGQTPIPSRRGYEISILLAFSLFAIPLFIIIKRKKKTTIK